ncbi:MAG: hypothetical protein AAF773_04555 [Cyanobacteria bacterium P01_D01_bin.115]
MAIPRKGTRKISIDGKAYRWFAQVDSDYFTKSFIIESIDDDRYCVTGGFEYQHDLVISPCIIEQAVQQAIEGGWEPGVSQVKKFIIDITKIEI